MDQTNIIIKSCIVIAPILMEKYLLEDTPEAREMIENLKLLLQSDQKANIELAFQIMSTAGVPRQLYPLLTKTNEKIFLCYKYRFFQILN